MATAKESSLIMDTQEQLRVYGVNPSRNEDSNLNKSTSTRCIIHHISEGPDAVEFPTIVL